MKKYTGQEIRELFARADSEGFAVPMFNYSDMWDLKAIVAAAEELRAPVMVGVDPPVFEDIGYEMCAAMVDVVTKEASVPIIHHLDHSSSVQECKKAIDLGVFSVMMDSSHKPIDENIADVRAVTDYAREKGAYVEAEIGRIRGESSYETSYTGDDYLFILDEAVKLVKEARPDALAIGIGNAHGFYVGKPELNFDKLKEANDALDAFLVLHGGTGIPEEDIRRAIKGGINKVNVGTAVYTAYMNGVRDKLMADGENQFTLEVMPVGVERCRQAVMEWIKTCMADGKA
ncbi:MAG: class II fructose-bisphosphate aldolase [Christensenella sp.]|uniref:class II fructose-bisphosphate aldolase n=1 Tax=Christensenella sp. TaxID=1935934 RepID=UPI002B1EB56F|nr:class II fructose-bisphosphate aldolase [Christensenella sp.]MEA5001937.1 class II fructose-bisphosphate aldolase [Christensenella sp.]